MKEKGSLIFFCGKMAAGKTTYSRKLASDLGAVYISEDDWLSTLYPDEINNFNDYLKYSSRLKLLIKDHVSFLLDSGLTVVMDFPGNTIKQREWFKEIFSEYNFPHKLVYLEADDNLCLQQLEKRRAVSPERHKFDTKEVFEYVTSFFEVPTTDEGFNIEIISV